MGDDLGRMRAGQRWFEFGENDHVVFKPLGFVDRHKVDVRVARQGDVFRFGQADEAVEPSRRRLFLLEPERGLDKSAELFRFARIADGEDPVGERADKTAQSQSHDLAAGPGRKSFARRGEVFAPFGEPFEIRPDILGNRIEKFRHRCRARQRGGIAGMIRHAQQGEDRPHARGGCQGISPLLAHLHSHLFQQGGDFFEFFACAEQNADRGFRLRAVNVPDAPRGVCRLQIFRVIDRHTEKILPLFGCAVGEIRSLLERNEPFAVPVFFGNLVLLKEFVPVQSGFPDRFLFCGGVFCFLRFLLGNRRVQGFAGTDRAENVVDRPHDFRSAPIVLNERIPAGGFLIFRFDPIEQFGHSAAPVVDRLLGVADAEEGIIGRVAADDGIGQRLENLPLKV